MELVSHIAKEHHKDEEAMTVQLKSTPNSAEEGKHTNFALSESMLGGFYGFISLTNTEILYFKVN